MREFELMIDKSLTNGLAPEPMPTNAEFLYQCLGFRCGKGRLESHVTLTNPLPVGLTLYYNWPFPQMITNERYNILVVRDSLIQHWDSVYLVSADHSTVTHIFNIDELTFGVGTMLEIADFGEYIFMTNGVLMLVWNVALGAWTNFTSSASIPMMKTVCNLKGQAVGGGVISAWYDCDETFYTWSNIGSMDFTPDKGNESGYRRCPYGGEIQNVRRLGNAVIGYSSKGITLIQPVPDPATIGFKELSNIGIINQGAVNGSLTNHLYVGEDYILRLVTAEGVKELGYQYYIQQLVGEDIIVSYDPSKQDFYIGNSTKTFLFSPSGLTEVLQHPSTVWRSNKVSYMLPESVDSSLPIITTEPFDMGYAGQKTLAVIESDITVTDSPEAGADYTNNNQVWTTSSYKPLNSQGVVTAPISGNAFKINLRFAEIYNNTRISYIKVRYKMTDLRGMRGVYAPPTSLRGQR